MEENFEWLKSKFSDYIPMASTEGIKNIETDKRDEYKYNKKPNDPNR